MTGEDLEAFVSAIEGALLPPGFSIANRTREYDDAGAQIAEFDVVITGRLGSTNISWLIECRDRPASGPAPGSWIEQLVGRRDRFRFDKVMAVSSTGFAAGAIEFAKEKGIDVRSTNRLSVDDVRNWLLAQEFTFAERSTRLEKFKVLIDQGEPTSVMEAAAEAVARYSPTSALLLNPRTGEFVHPRDAFLAVVNLHPELWPTPPEDGWVNSVKLHAVYPSDDRFVLQLPTGHVEIPEIVFDGVLSVRAVSVPFTQFADYVDCLTGKTIASSAGGTIEMDGAHYTLTLDRLVDGDSSRLAVRMRKQDTSGAA